jgi:hypothetical protein
MNNKPKPPHYAKVTIKAAVGGWIVEEDKKPTQVYSFWDHVIRRLENSLTSKGDPGNTTT